MLIVLIGGLEVWFSTTLSIPEFKQNYDITSMKPISLTRLIVYLLAFPQ